MGEANDNLLVIHWGRNGGGPRFTVRMAEGLAKAWPGETYLSIHEQAAADWQPDFDPARVSTVRTYTTALGVLNLPRFIANVLRTRRLIRRHRISTVYSGMISIWHSIGIRIILPRGVRYLSSIHDPTAHPGDEDNVLRLAKAMDLSRANIAVGYTRSAAERIEPQVAADQIPVVWVPHGVDAPTVTEPRAAPCPAQPVRLGLIGRLTHYKGIDIFADAIAELRERGFAVRGVVAGQGDVPPGLIRRSSEFIEWDVRWIEEREMAEVFDRFDVLVLPYREASQSGVFTLGLSYGLPVVVTPQPGLVEQAEQAGAGLVAADVTPASVADAVERLLVDPDEFEAQAAASFEAAKERLSWPAVAGALVSQVRGVERSQRKGGGVRRVLGGVSAFVLRVLTRGRVRGASFIIVPPFTIKTSGGGAF